MITKNEYEGARDYAVAMLTAAGTIITPAERESIEVTDLDLGDFRSIGVTILVYVNTNRVCAKELILGPGQTCPEHRHPPVAGEAGKEETFRVRRGLIVLCVPGPPTAAPQAVPPPARKEFFTARREIVLHTGDQYTLPPDMLHWFQAGPAGAVVSEFSTRSRDETDLFTDPDICRTPPITED